MQLSIAHLLFSTWPAERVVASADVKARLHQRFRKRVWSGGSCPEPVVEPFITLAKRGIHRIFSSPTTLRGSAARPSVAPPTSVVTGQLPDPDKNGHRHAEQSGASGAWRA
jgi:hypothetical protein